MKIGQTMKLLLATSLLMSAAHADQTPAERTAELVKQDRIRAVIAQNPALANLAMQIAKQVRK